MKNEKRKNVFRVVTAVSVLLVSITSVSIRTVEGRPFDFRPHGHPAPWPGIVHIAVGTLVAVIPPAASTIEVGGVRYYVSDGVYYRAVHGGYMVVSDPCGNIKPEVEVGDKLQVWADLLNVRTGPGMEYGVAMQIEKGALLVVKGIDNEWCFIYLQDGSSGWIQRKYAIVVDSGAKG